MPQFFFKKNQWVIPLLNPLFANPLFAKHLHWVENPLFAKEPCSAAVLFAKPFHRVVPLQKYCFAKGTCDSTVLFARFFSRGCNIVVPLKNWVLAKRACNATVLLAKSFHWVVITL